jgi:hypothetical protein
MSDSISEAERERLGAYRAAAAKIRSRTAVDQSFSVPMHGEADGSITIQLMDAEPFVALLAAVRLVYMDKEPAHFYGVCNILWRRGPQDIKDRAAAVREKYRKTVEGGHSDMRIDGVHLTPRIEIIVDDHKYSAADVLETFMYGEELHRDIDRREDLERLRSTGGFAAGIAHGMLLALAGRIIDLDDVIADFLGEKQLERFK